jgi:hypothetical protein
MIAEDYISSEDEWPDESQYTDQEEQGEADYVADNKEEGNEEKKSKYELYREENIKERQKLMEELGIPPEFSLGKPKEKKKVVREKRKKDTEKVIAPSTRPKRKCVPTSSFKY